MKSWRGGRQDGDSHLLEELLDVGARADLLRERVEDVKGEILRLDLVVLPEERREAKTTKAVFATFQKRQTARERLTAGRV